LSVSPVGVVAVSEPPFRFPYVVDVVAASLVLDWASVSAVYPGAAAPEAPGGPAGIAPLPPLEGLDLGACVPVPVRRHLEGGLSEPEHRQVSVSDALTPQQLQIARLAAAGATNREVAKHLFLSTRTVDHHMRNIFARLGIRSRVDLAKLMN